MSASWRIAVVFLLVSCATVSAPERAEREIRLQYDRLERAFEARDIPAILALRHPDMEVIGPNGQRDGYEQMAEYTRQWFVTNKPPIQTRITIESIEMKSDSEAAVRVLQRASRYQDREGKLRRVEHEVRQRETWVRTPDGWKIKNVDDIDLANRKRWIDGQLEVKPTQ